MGGMPGKGGMPEFGGQNFGGDEDDE